MKKSAILVTGGMGFIGCHVVQKLKEYSNVIVIDNLTNPYVASAPNNVTLVKADIGDEQALEQIFSKNNIESVLHFAAFTKVSESMNNPELFYENNLINTWKLLNKCRKFNVKNFIFSSTAAVYGNSENKIDDRQRSNAVCRALDENSLTAPISPYGRSKLMSEQMIRDVAIRCGMNCISLRYFNVAGNAISTPASNIQCNSTSGLLIEKVAQSMLNDVEIEVFGDKFDTHDGTCIRDYIHVADLAKIHVLSLEYLQNQTSPCQLVLNAGYGEGYSVLDIIKVAQEILQKPIKYRISAAREGDPAKVVANNKRICQTLQWHPEFNDLKLIIGSSFAWQRNLAEQQRSAKAS